MTKARNPLLDEREACRACGAPTFTLRYGPLMQVAGRRHGFNPITDAWPSLEELVGRASGELRARAIELVGRRSREALLQLLGSLNA